MKIIARIYTDFPDKFGVPRQSGLVPGLTGRIVFEPEYRDASALRGLDGFSHIWLIWKFSGSVMEKWSPTVRPPRLGGDTRMGVFATRSPFRPNPIGLSCVKLERIEYGSEGPVICVSGIDMIDNTPIFDIKPYLPDADCKPDALSGFAGKYADYRLKVEFSEGLGDDVAPEKLSQLEKVLACDPRPAYQNDPERIYGMSFAGLNVKFKVSAAVLTVVGIEVCKDT